jgi:hypothetical protein
MTCEDQVFVSNVVVTNLTREMVAMSVISQPTSAIVEFNAIVKIHKYKRLHEGHHFILMAMEVHGTPECDMDSFIKECVCLFHNRWSRGHLSLYFCIQFFRQCVSIAFQRALVFTIKRKITLARDVCSRPPITIKSHNLHACDIKGAVSEIVSSHKRDYLSPFFGS